MRHIFYLLCCCMVVCNANSQNKSLDSLFQKIAVEKNDSTRFYLAFSALTTSETNPVDDMGNAEIILVYGQKHNDKVCQVQGLSCLGYDYRAFGNTTKSLAYSIKALTVAESSHDNRLLAPCYWLMAANYLDLQDYPKAKFYCLRAIDVASHVEINLFTILNNLTMGEIYLAASKIDSALMYTQKSYELSMSSGIKEYIGGVYEQLGTIQSKLKNSSLALSYLNLALNTAVESTSPKYISLSNYALADYYSKNNQNDSALFHAKKAVSVVQHTAFSTMSLKPAKLLLDLYRNKNVDSAFKFSEIHRIANDSLFNFKTLQEAQLMTFEEDARQNELSVAKSLEEEQQRENIQYILIGLGIITVIILYLLLSRSFITNAKAIEFFGVIALLIVFEFLNLLLHPYLENLTHHSPILMLLALVCIAALLVPFHHKIEHWATSRLVEKNKQIRLAAAKRTIQQLGSESGN